MALSLEYSRECIIFHIFLPEVCLGGAAKQRPVGNLVKHKQQSSHREEVSWTNGSNTPRRSPRWPLLVSCVKPKVSTFVWTLNFRHNIMKNEPSHTILINITNPHYFTILMWHVMKGLGQRKSRKNRVLQACHYSLPNTITLILWFWE